MIITKLIGGLGNQMFQYSIARALSCNKHTSLRLDISGYNNYNLHQGFELCNVFDVSAEIATISDIHNVLGWQSSQSVRQILSRLKLSKFNSSKLVLEPNFNFWPEILNSPNPCYLDGYWQSEKYFIDFSALIRKDFTFKNELDSHNLELASIINKTNSVSIHIRRGDYVNNLKTNATHGLCSIDYYSTAFNYITERIESPYFFIFSDDIEWARKNISLNFPCQFISHNIGSKSYVDMQLMSLCKHNVIANSSFSWWGAWLNTNESKIVIAPSKWFAVDTDVSDLIPSNWVSL
jgi:hypothetical protein